MNANKLLNRPVHRGLQVVTYDGFSGTLTGGACFDLEAEEDKEARLLVEIDWDDGKPTSFIGLDTLSIPEDE